MMLVAVAGSVTTVSAAWVVLCCTSDMVKKGCSKKGMEVRDLLKRIFAWSKTAKIEAGGLGVSQRKGNNADGGLDRGRVEGRATVLMRRSEIGRSSHPLPPTAGYRYLDLEF